MSSLANPERILVVHNSYQERGGEDVVVENELMLLKDRGHHVQFAQVSNHSIRGWFKTIQTGISSSNSRWGYEWMQQQIRDYQPNLVHVHNFFPLLSPSIFRATQDCHVPVVMTLHNFRLTCSNGLLLRNGVPCELCIEGSPYQGALHGCYRGSRLASFSVARMIAKHRSAGTWVNRVEKFIALSEFSRSRLSRAGIPREKIIIKPNFLSESQTERFKALKRGKNSAPVGLYVGRLSDEKGIRTLLDAWKSPPCRLRIIGSGPLEKEIRSNQSWGIDYIGKQSSEQVALAMANADFLVVPSICYENFPMVVIEAFAAGLPVIVSGHGGLSDLVQDGTTGLWFQPGHPDSLRERVVQLISSPKMSTQISANALSAFQSRFTAESNYRLLLEIYQSAMAATSS